MSNEIAIIQNENVAAIAAKAPVAFTENQKSHDRCIQFGQNIIDKILKSGGMNDELDKEAAEFIDRSRKTVKKMNEQRSPVTKLFDEIRTVFTTMENEVDPAKPDSVPGQLQKFRNEYAAKKHAEAEARRLAEERKQRIEAAKKKYRTDVEAEFKQSFNRYLNSAFNELSRLNASVTLDNFDEVSRKIADFPVSIPEDSLKSIFHSSVPRSLEVDTPTLNAIAGEVSCTLAPQFKEQYSFEMESNRDSITDMLPSKKQELEAIAKASVEEAARRKLELEQREAEESRRREEERLHKEREEQDLQKLKQQQIEVCTLFDQAGANTSRPKIQVKKKIVINDARGVLDILNLWWVNEGCSLSVDELAKKFKPQITFCEKLANDKGDPKTIQSGYISYIDDIKAK